MRLKPQKIDRLAELIFETLAANTELNIQETRDKMVGLIRGVITEDLQTEDQIEEEAKALLEKHMDEINRTGAAYSKLLLKAKQKLAAERKMVL